LNWLRLSGLSEATIRLRRDHLRSIARRSKTQQPNQLTRGHLMVIMTERQWSNDHKKALRATLNSFYLWCIDEELAEDNVAQCLPKVKAPLPNPRPTPDRIWSELLATAPPRERLMALLAGEAGLRRAEIAVVHTDDLSEDMDGCLLLVHGKGGKPRIVPITDRLFQEIMKYRHYGYLFPGKIDGHISVHYVGELISRLMPPGWSAHKLRHRFSSRAYGQTGNLHALKEVLGHSSVATTEVYVKVSRRDVRAVVEAATADGNATNMWHQRV
jgi:integrase